jgi:hypothetical protein
MASKTRNRPLAHAAPVIRELVCLLALEAGLNESEWLAQLREEKNDG